MPRDKRGKQKEASRTKSDFYIDHQWGGGGHWGQDCCLENITILLKHSVRSPYSSLSPSNPETLSPF